MSDKKQKIAEQILQLHLSYKEEVPDRFDEISATWTQLTVQWSTQLAIELYAHLHKMAGSAGSFGFKALSENAREAERLLLPYREPNTNPNQDQIKSIELSIEQLKKTDITGKDNLPLSLEGIDLERPTSENHTVYVLDDDIHFSRSLKLQLKSYGYDVRTHSSIEHLHSSLKAAAPAAVLVDIMLSEGEFAGPRFVKELRASKEIEFPIIVYSQRSDFAARLEAVQAGSDAYFVKPFDIGSLITPFCQNSCRVS